MVRVGNLLFKLGKFSIIFLLYNFGLSGNTTANSQSQAHFSEFSEATNLGSKSMFHKLSQELVESKKVNSTFQFSKASTNIQPSSSEFFSGEKRIGTNLYSSKTLNIFKILQNNSFYCSYFHIIDEAIFHNFGIDSRKTLKPTGNTLSQFTGSFDRGNYILVVARGKYVVSEFISFASASVINSAISAVPKTPENLTQYADFVAVSYAAISNSLTNVSLNECFACLDELVGFTTNTNASYVATKFTKIRYFSLFGELATYSCSYTITSFEWMDLNATVNYIVVGSLFGYSSLPLSNSFGSEKSVSGGFNLTDDLIGNSSGHVNMVFISARVRFTENYNSTGGLIEASVNSIGNSNVNTSVFVSRGQNKIRGLFRVFTGNLANSYCIVLIITKSLYPLKWQKNLYETVTRSTEVLKGYFTVSQAKNLDNFSFTNDIVNTNNFFNKLGGLIGNTSSAVINSYYNTNLSNFTAGNGVGRTTKRLSSDLNLFGERNSKAIWYSGRYTYQSLQFFSNCFLLFPSNTMIYNAQSTEIPRMLTGAAIGTVQLNQDGIETTIIQILDPVTLTNHNITRFNVNTFNSTMYAKTWYVKTTLEMETTNEICIRILIPSILSSSANLNLDYFISKKLASEELATYNSNNATLYLSREQGWKKKAWDNATTLAFDVKPINSGIHSLARENTGETARKFSDDVPGKVEPFSILSSPDDVLYPVGATDNTISWKISNFTGQIFSKLFRNGSLIGITLTQNGGRWSRYAIDRLEIGTHNFTLVVTDNKSFESKDTVMVTVRPVVPVVLSAVNSLFFPINTTGNMINWTISTDSNLGIAELYRNGTKIGPTQTWDCNTTFTYNVDNLKAGLYNFTMVIVDLNGNKTTGLIIVIAFQPTIIILNPIQPVITSTIEKQEVLLSNLVSKQLKLLFPFASLFALFACLSLLAWKRSTRAKTQK